jgi:hypothetical protein
MNNRVLVAALGALVCACNVKEGPTAPPFAFAVPAVGVAPDFAQLPWPNDLYLDAQGHPAVGSFEPLSDTEFLQTIRTDLSTRDGFGVTSGAFFVPPPGLEVGSLDGHVLLLDLEGGPAIPVTSRLRADGLLCVRLQNGHALLQRHRYAFVLTKGIKANGLPVGVSDDFRALRDASHAPGETRLAAAWQVMSPLFEGLEAKRLPGGPAKGDVISATVFTTQSITKLLGAAHDVVGAQEIQPAQVAYVFADPPQAGDDGSLDDFLTHPDTTLPGCVYQCTSADEGIFHDHLAFVVHGAFVAPDFLAATVPSTDPKKPNTTKQGTIQVDANRAPVPLGRTLIPFTLALPKLSPGGAYANLPVVIFQHGLGGDRESVSAVGDTLAAAGVATIGIDMVFHGLREPGASDVHHNIGCHTDAVTHVRTCPPGPDGFSDTSGDAFLYFFDTLPQDPSFGVLSPALMRAAFQEAVIDLMSLVQLLERGSFAALGQRDSRLAGLSFRPGPYAYLAESFGSVMGTMALAVEKDIGAATLAVDGGGLVLPLALWSADFGPLATPLVSSVAQIDPSDDPLETDPAFNLLQQLVEPGDPLAFAPYVIDHPLSGVPPKNVLMIEAYKDETVPNVATESLAGAMGLDFVQTATGGVPVFDFVSPPPLLHSAPVAGNRAVAMGTVTGGLVQMQIGTHGMLARQKGQRTRDTRLQSFPRLPEAVDINNPIQALQNMATTFATDYYAGRPPRIADQ